VGLGLAGPLVGLGPVLRSEVRSEPGALTPELRDRLLCYASRAPSPHNAQGWRVEGRGRTFRVRRDDPPCAAEVLFALARVLADRQNIPAFLMAFRSG
jgi:hypothetical protein